MNAKKLAMAAVSFASLCAFGLDGAIAGDGAKRNGEWISKIVPKSCNGTAAKHVRLMSFNIRMGCGHSDPFRLEKGSVGYLPKCAEVIRAADPDYAGLQEVDRNSKRAGFMDQTKVVADLSGMHGEWVEKIKDYGISMLSKRRPVSVDNVLIEGQVHTRSLMISDFGDFAVANTHFPLSAGKRLAAAATVKDALKKISARKIVFLMGDLNAVPDSPEIASLKEDFEVISDEVAPTWPAEKPERVLDYIMVDKAHAARVRAVSRQTVAVPQATDHAAVIVDVEIEQRSGVEFR